MTSLDCLVFAAGCIEDPNPAKSSKSPKAEVTHWEELAFCGYKRNIYQIENYFPNVPTLVRIQTQTNAKHLKINSYKENSPLPHVIFATFVLIVSWQILDWMSFNVSYHLSLNTAV